MTDQKKEGNAAAEKRLSNILKEGLTEEMGEIPEVSISVDELKRLEAADRKKKIRRRARIASIAAAVVIVFGAAIFAAWPKIAVPVDADKNTEQHVEEKDGVVIINEGDVEGDKGKISVTETDWDKVGELRIYIPNLYIPEYVPNGYAFEEVRLIRYSDETYDSEFVFRNNSDEVLTVSQTKVLEDDLQTDFVGRYTEKAECDLGDIYITKHQKGISGTLVASNDRIFVFGAISNKELESIFQNLKRN